MIKDKHIYNALLYVAFPVLYIVFMLSLNTGKPSGTYKFVSKSYCESISIEIKKKEPACRNLKVISYNFLWSLIMLKL